MVYVHTSWPDCRRCKQQAGGPRDRHRQTLSPSQRQTDRHTQVHTYVHISNLSIATKPRNSPVYLSLRFLMASGVRSPSATVIWVPTTACPRRHCPTRKLFEAAERHHLGTARFDVTDRIGSLHSSLQLAVSNRSPAKTAGKGVRSSTLITNKGPTDPSLHVNVVTVLALLHSFRKASSHGCVQRICVYIHMSAHTCTHVQPHAEGDVQINRSLRQSTKIGTTRCTDLHTNVRSNEFIGSRSTNTGSWIVFCLPCWWMLIAFGVHCLGAVLSSNNLRAKENRIE